MKARALLYAGAALPLLWGAAHLFPTGSIVRGFGDISTDNRRIIAMEWIVEGVALVFIGALAAAVTRIDPRSRAAAAVYLGSAACLVVLAVAIGLGARGAPLGNGAQARLRGSRAGHG